MNQALPAIGSGTSASALVPRSRVGIVATTTPFDTISSFSIGTMERRLTFAVRRRGPAGSEISSPGILPSSEKEITGPFDTNVRPAFRAASQPR